MSYKSKFSPFASVLSEGFTDRDATPPLSWAARRTDFDEVTVHRVGADGKTIEKTIVIDEVKKQYKTFRKGEK